MRTLSYVSSSNGDWCGIYIDDNLLIEGHSIPVHEWLQIIKTLLIDTTKEHEVEGDWLEEGGSFPQSFSDIPSEYLS